MTARERSPDVTVRERQPSDQKRANKFLEGVVVADLGLRAAVSACGSLLAQLGASVIFIELETPASAAGIHGTPRDLAAAGKLSVRIDGELEADRAYLQQLLHGVDILLTSRDEQPPWLNELIEEVDGRTILCDMSSFGGIGPHAGHVLSELFLQAITGLMHTTGEPMQAPVACRFPLVEHVAALYGVVGVMAALKARREQNICQRIDLSLYECAISTLTTFMPAYLVGQRPMRIGNHHPSMSPWNAYRAADGWVLMCAGSDDQWRRVCEIIGKPDLAADTRYDSTVKRVKAAAELDVVVEGWTATRSVAECVDAFNQASIACGPVSKIEELLADINLHHRGMIVELESPRAKTALMLPGTLFHGSRCRGVVPMSIPGANEHREKALALAQREAGRFAAVQYKDRRPALNGIRVVEIGNYTAGPFVSRQLGALGAYVVKVEPPSGDLARALPPHREGQGYFFTLSNHDKRSLKLDLKLASDKASLRNLLRDADVLIENLRPGVLAKLGFSADDLADLNPRLVYCTISGYGIDSPWSERPGMDTTIQGAGGIMHFTQATGVPYKSGVSSADIAAGLVALGGVLAALEYRDRTGFGQHLDVSMQDAAAWLTHGAWNKDSTGSFDWPVIGCSDGYFVAAADAERLRVEFGLLPSGLYPGVRQDIMDRLHLAGIACVPVRSINEVMEHPQTCAGEIMVKGHSVSGKEWPLMRSPLRLSATPAVVRRAIGDIGADAAEIGAEWKTIAPRASLARSQ